MPIGIGSPVARMSTLIVDSNLTMYGYAINTAKLYGYPSSESTIDMRRIALENIYERVAGRGVQIFQPGNAEQWDAVASDKQRKSDDTEGFWTSAVWTQVKSITVPSYYRAGSIIRTSFDIRDSVGGATEEGRIYVNGSPVGTLQSTTSGTYVTFTEDISVTGGDTVELWVNNPGVNACYYRNFRLYADDTIPNYIKGAAW